MTDRSGRSMRRLAAWARSPRGGALLAALLTLAVLLPLWFLAIDWYRTELLSVGPSQRSLLVFEVGGLLMMALLAGLVFLSVNRQALLSEAVHQRTEELARQSRHLEEDLAQRRQMEEELRRSEERHRAVARSFPNGGVFLFDSNLRYILADGAGLAEVGLSKEILEGLTIWEALSPETVAIVEPHYRAALAGEPHVFEVAFGGHMYLSRTLPLRDDRGVIIAGMAVTQDITDTKRAEAQREAALEALRASEARSQALLNAIPDMMFRVNRDGVFLDYHADASDMVLPPEAVIGGSLRQLPAPEGVVECMLRKIGAALDTNQIQTLEYSLHTVGGLKDFEARMVADGPNEVIAIVRDISERKHAEAELREREEQYRSIFEASLDGLFINSLDGYIVDVNPAGARMHDYTVEECRGLRSELLVPPDRLAGLQEFLDMARAGEQFRARGFDRRKGGSTFPVEIVGTQFLYRGQPHALAVVRDITETVQAEQALQEREIQYRNVFESSVDGLFINDLAGRLVDFNPAAASMHGYTVEEFRQIQPAQFVHPDSLPLFAEFMEAIKAGREYYCRAVDLRKDGSSFPIEVRGTPFALRGEPHAFAIVRDISAQVEAEQQLEQRVAERTRELSTLLDVSRSVTSTLEIEPLLGLILEQLKILVGYDGAGLLTLQGDVLTVRDYRGPIPREQALHWRFPLEQSPIDREIIRRREPIIIDDVRDDTELARAFRESAGARLGTFLEYIRSWLAVPLLIKERTIGIMALDHLQPQYYTNQHARLAMAIANQAAIAIENARLFTETQGKAVLEERQRLARDLHDSVTQSLYSLTLLAEAGRRLVADDAQQTARYLSDIGEIAQQSLKEMRLLVYQLRPLALEREGLIGALQARLDSVEKRAGIEARLLIEGQLSHLPPALEEGLFRIAQEALNNALKHAAARSVVVRVRGVEDRVILEVADDGRGSALLATDMKGGLGLTSMKERVAQLQGALAIDSAPGEGTRITVEVPRLMPAAA